MVSSTAVNSLDEVFINLASRALMSVHLEVRVTGQIDVDRLAGAIRSALSIHPMARARLAPTSWSARRLQWEIPAHADHVAVSVTDEPIDVVRSRLLSRQPDLYVSPAFLPVVVRHPEGDHLVLNLHHAIFDGMSALRLLRSIAHAYAGELDQPGGPELEIARDLTSLVGARSMKDLAPRAAKVGRDVLDRARLTRVAEDGGDPGDASFAVTTLRLAPDETEAVLRRRPTGATVNDIVLAAHTLSILRWNRAHGARLGDRVSTMMPVNLRPTEWATEVVSNFASYLAIMIPTSVPDDLTTATAMVREHTAPAKENGAAGWVVDLLEPGNIVPAIARKAFAGLLPLVEKHFIETTVLSNVGRVELPAFGDAGEVQEVWFTPPGMAVSGLMPIAVGVVGVGRELFIAFRTDRRVVSDAAAAEFAELFRATLTG
ncbi:condensation domain-containing protein [Nocardioides sp.]|uniref:condensation domain-containing protein n=1 Tax=Nocardioides sp. TaxID=35761 RepID=UPI002CFBCDB1|nr:condensation domain-containing protein [Nocardioides sp.]HSX66841.1 condensation domain-containing protein [Nocardioides sp.]